MEGNIPYRVRRSSLSGLLVSFLESSAAFWNASLLAIVNCVLEEEENVRQRERI